MPTLHVPAGSSDHLQNIADALWKAKKVVVITGAGISTNSGIPDFRSENGLYSMIQSQFDAAEKLGAAKPQTSGSQSDDSGFDERPRKRRKTSPPIEDSIEVIPTVSSEDLNCSTRCDDDDTETTGSNEEPQRLDDSNGDDNNRSDLDADSQVSTSDARDAPQNSSEEEVVLLSEQSIVAGDYVVYPDDDGGNIVHTEVEHSPSNRPKEPQEGKAQEGKAQEDETHPGEPATLQSASSRQSSSHSCTTAQTQARAQTRKATIPTLKLPDREAGPKARQAGRVAALSSNLSTPKHPTSKSTPQTSSSSPLSSPPSHLSDVFDEQSTEPAPSSRPSSPVSDEDEGGEAEDKEDDSQPCSSQEHLNRSSTFKRSLSTLKGRELFDSSIWSDPLKTSVFYTFATNLRQKSRDASPTGCHHFINHLSKAGKMVRCYTQNIDLLEDKVGLSTRLLLGPGSRGRFSTRVAKALAGSTIARNALNNSNNQPAAVTDVSCPAVAQDPPQHAGNGVSSPQEPCTAESQKIPSAPLGEVDGGHQKSNGGDERVPELKNEPDRQCNSQRSEEREKDGTAAGSQPVGTNSLKSLPEKAPPAKADSGTSTPEHNKGVECVFLHGSLRALRCFQCGCVADWDEGDRELQTMSGQQPPCPRCEDATVARQERGKRALGVGKLRPDIVLYGEEHPESHRISTIIQHDISLAPDMLIVMGTSLKVHGLKTVVREFAKTVHNRKDGKVIFVNYTKPADSVWADVFDFWIEMDCDAWVQDLKEKKPIMWLPPGSVEEEPKGTKRRRPAKDEAEKKDSKRPKNIEDAESTEMKSTATLEAPQKSKTTSKAMKPDKLKKEELPEDGKPAPKRPAAVRDCKQNAVYWTLKIMADLAKMSGREVQPLSLAPSSSKIMPVSTTAAPPAGSRSTKQNAAPSPAGPVKTRRGPRTKNTKSRLTFLGPDATSKSTAKQPKTSRKNGKSKADTKVQQCQHDDSVAVAPLKIIHAQFPSVEGRPEQAVASPSVKEEVVEVSPAQAHAVLLMEDSVPSTGAGTTGEGNSIVNAVKSNPRFRKPKAIFGEAKPPSDRASRCDTSAGNAKGKTKSLPQQTKKAKILSSLPEQPAQMQNLQEAHSGLDLHMTQKGMPPIPSLPPQSIPTMADGSQPRTPQEAITLAPLLQANARLEGRDSFLRLTLGQSHFHSPSTATPPSYLEPIVSPGPPPNMSPDMSPILSPNHWRERAFGYGDVSSRQLSPPRRCLDFTATPQNGPPGSPPASDQTLGRPMPGPSQQPHRVEARPLIGYPVVPGLSSPMPVVPISDDNSADLQLRRESEAAATLSQMFFYDNRRSARV